MSTDHERYVANILAMYRAASVSDLRDGLSWYSQAHDFARLISPHDVARGAGIIAALSPLMGWESNMLQASRLVQRGCADGLGLTSNCQKAMRIYNGENPLDVLSGDKVRSFYLAILNPTSNTGAVVDRHAYDVATGYITPEGSEKALKNKGVYAAFATAYAEAARIANIGTPAMQAITWLTVRRLKAQGFFVVAPSSDFILAA